MSLRWKLTLWFAGTVAVVLAGFVAVDCIGLSRNLLRTGLSNLAVRASLQEAVWEHGLLALVTIASVVVVGHVTIKRALRPVGEMVSLARSITAAEDLSRRITSASAGDEIGELAETLNAMIGRLERSFLHARQFSGIVAHELNTPLTILKSELEVAQRRERTPEEHRELLPRLQREVERLSALVENLLLVSRLEAQGAAIELRDEPLDQLALEIYEEYQGWAHERGVTLGVDVPERAIIRGERALLRMLVANLVVNGVRYTPRGGKVEIKVEQSAHGVQMRITDTGQGIAAEALPHIFEPFYRAEAALADTEGTGLGMTIVRRVADLHCCKLDLASEIGAGTTVTVTWPR